MRKIHLFIIVIFLSININYSQTSVAKEYAMTITEQDLKDHLYVYASDEFEGRDTGAPGQKKAVEYIRNFYKSIDVSPGDPDKDYFQPMSLKIRQRRGQPLKEVDSENVIAIIEGNEKADEYVVITAHLDHVGMNDGEIYNGADDDGSGSIALLELAEAFKEAKKNGNGTKRSIVFLHVTGEEKGLLGSKYYTDEDPIYPLENTVVNLNVDMIGRIDPTREAKNRDYIYLIGSDHDSQDLHDISEKSNLESVNITLDYRFNDKNDPNRFYYRSDHYNFAKNGIPIIFYFSGTHEDYHQPTDTPDKIDYDILEMRTKLIFHTAWNIANREERLVLDEKPEEANDTYKHTLEEIKSFGGIYKTEAFPLQFKFYEAYGKLNMVPLGGSNEEALILEGNGKNKFKSEMAGVSLEFKIDVTKSRTEVKNVSSKGMNVQIEEKTKKAKKMVLNISGNEILFNEILPETKEE